ncbi:MAG: hypothetical protein ACOCYE_05825, partial [Pseudomonadota bacterium]
AVLAVGTLFGRVARARRRVEVERDSDAFAEALARTLPFVHRANPTPRAVKLFENRMRYLATRLDAEANPDPPDFLDRLFRPFLPAARFEAKPSALDERKLVVLGAELAARREDWWDVRNLAQDITEQDRAVFARITGRASEQDAG